MPEIDPFIVLLFPILFVMMWGVVLPVVGDCGVLCPETETDVEAV
jgi:hypothetical protein